MLTSVPGISMAAWLPLFKYGIRLAIIENILCRHEGRVRTEEGKVGPRGDILFDLPMGDNNRVSNRGKAKASASRTYDRETV
jgi:hypothetical protein